MACLLTEPSRRAYSRTTGNADPMNPYLGSARSLAPLRRITPLTRIFLEIGLESLPFG
jgi:hypothetical protein